MKDEVLRGEVKGLDFEAGDIRLLLTWLDTQFAGCLRKLTASVLNVEEPTILLLTVLSPMLRDDHKHPILIPMISALPYPSTVSSHCGYLPP